MIYCGYCNEKMNGENVGSPCISFCNPMCANFFFRSNEHKISQTDTYGIPPNRLPIDFWSTEFLGDDPIHLYYFKDPFCRNCFKEIEAAFIGYNIMDIFCSSACASRFILRKQFQYQLEYIDFAFPAFQLFYDDVMEKWREDQYRGQDFRIMAFEPRPKVEETIELLKLQEMGNMKSNMETLFPANLIGNPLILTKK